LSQFSSLRSHASDQQFSATRIAARRIIQPICAYASTISIDGEISLAALLGCGGHLQLRHATLQEKHAPLMRQIKIKDVTPVSSPSVYDRMDSMSQIRGHLKDTRSG
jgi:hypothetical protein